MTVNNPRRTKYCVEIERRLKSLGHATNAELLSKLRETYPKLSATTVHRATARLAQRGIIAVAPLTCVGCTRYDANIRSHDHFLCSSCGLLVDVDIKDKIAPIIKAAANGFSLSGELIINGVCGRCQRGEKNENNSL